MTLDAFSTKNQFCGGHGKSMEDYCGYYAVSMSTKSKYYNFVLFAPKELKGWLFEAVLATLHTIGYWGKKEILFVFLVTDVNIPGEKVKNEFPIAGFTHTKDKRVFISINRNAFGILKRLDPAMAKATSSSRLHSLISVIWHEVNHLKKKKVNDFPNKEEFFEVLDVMRELLDDK